MMAAAKRVDFHDAEGYPAAFDPQADRHESVTGHIRYGREPKNGFHKPLVKSTLQQAAR